MTATRYWRTGFVYVSGQLPIAPDGTKLHHGFKIEIEAVALAGAA
jgi:enamine deaminase RidA (YjgF/YER057c/UK114 family)